MSVKSIVVLGSGRSGTSFLANLLAENRVYSGDCTQGTRENLQVRKINEDCLAKQCNGITRSKLPYGILPNKEIIVDDEFQIRSGDFVKRMAESMPSTWWNESDNYWMFKDPRTTLLHDMWVKHCDIIIGVFRNPVEVVESYMKLLEVYYPGEAKEQGYINMLNYWKRFNQSLLHVFNTTDKQKYLLDFNDDIDNQTEELFQMLDIPRTMFRYDVNRREQKSDNIYDDQEVTDIYTYLKNLI